MLVLLVVFVVTFLGAAVFNIAAGEPFTPPQVLWIHFVVNAAFGFSLGFDRETPGLMTRVPRARGTSLLTRSLLITVGLTGLVIAAMLLGMIQLGARHHGDVDTGVSIAFTAFALCLVVAALQCRSETDSVLTTATFDSPQMNRAIAAEIVIAVLTTQMDALRRVLGTTDLSLPQFGWALLPPVVLFVLWELGKLVARRTIAGRTIASRER